MKRPLAALLTVAATLVCLAGCSDYQDEFAAEPMIIFQLDVVNVTNTTATITWSTSKKGSSEVYYKRVTSYEDLVRDDTEVLEHAVTLTNLFPQTEYTCRVISRNGDGYSEEWQDIVFTTKPNPAVLPPEPSLP